MVLRSHRMPGQGRAVDQGRPVRLELDAAVLPQRFIPNQMRLGLFVLAYTLGNFLRRLVLPRRIKHWSLRTLLAKLIDQELTRFGKLSVVRDNRFEFRMQLGGGKESFLSLFRDSRTDRGVGYYGGCGDWKFSPIRQHWMAGTQMGSGIVKLTHHKLRQPQDIVSETTSEYSMGWLGPSATS